MVCSINTGMNGMTPLTFGTLSVYTNKAPNEIKKFPILILYIKDLFLLESNEYFSKAERSKSNYQKRKVHTIKYK